jgi:hypothetical protein
LQMGLETKNTANRRGTKWLASVRRGTMSIEQTPETFQGWKHVNMKQLQAA